MESGKRENWGSSLGFVLAVAGSAIGLGNIWKFPYVTGMNGGGAFVLVYVLCALLLGLPVMLCEMILGRATGRNPYGAFKALQAGRSRFLDVVALVLFLVALVEMIGGNIGVGICTVIFASCIAVMGFSCVGLLSIIGGLFILSYYSVVGGWILDYTLLSFTGQLTHTEVALAADAFGNYVSSPWRQMVGHVIFMLLCALFLWGGVRSGIERWSKILMPMLFGLVVVVIIRGITLPGASKGISFFLKPDFSVLTIDSLLSALGQVFYSLSLAMGITITYGSYLSKKQNVFNAAYSVLGLDTLISLLAGLAIFPAVFAMNMNPAEGPGLIFQVLPVTFNSIPGGMGWLWSGLFFLILAIAALTSGGSLLELAITFLHDEFKMSRRKAIVVSTIGVTLFGLLPCLSVVNWDHLSGLHNFLVKCFGEELVPSNYFDMLDHLTSNWMLPINGFFICIFVGWIWGTRKASDELRHGANPMEDCNLFVRFAGLGKEAPYVNCNASGMTMMTLWCILTRFVAPTIIATIFLKAIGLSF